MKFKASISLALCVICALFLLAAGAVADDAKKAGEAEKKTEKKADAKADKADDENGEKWFALTGGDVYTVTGPVIRKATVLVKDGKIVALGRDLTVPEGAEELDVTGMRVYPGLVAVSSSGMVGREPPENTTDLYGMNMILGLSAGLTTVVTGNTVAKLTYGTTEGMVLKRGIFTTLRYSRRSPMQRREMRVDLARVQQYLRDLEAYGAAKARGDKDAKEPDKKWIRGKYSTYLSLLQGSMTALMSADNMQDLRDAADLAHRFGFKLVIRGGIEGWSIAPELGRKGVAMILTPRRKPRGGMYGMDEGDEGESADDLIRRDESGAMELDLLGLSDGPGDDSAVHDASEADSQVCNDDAGTPPVMEGEDEHAEVDAPLAKPSWGSNRLLRPNGWTIENARILYESGVPFAIIPQSTRASVSGIAGRDMLMMPMEAAFAVRGGLPEAAAIESITIGAARMLGVDHRVGSIEVGKDADFIVCDGDLLHYRTMVQWSIVNGRVVYDKEKESLFSHIRPRGKEGTEPHPEIWPRAFGEMPSYKPDVEPPAPGEEPSGEDGKDGKDGEEEVDGDEGTEKGAGEGPGKGAGDAPKKG